MIVTIDTDNNPFSFFIRDVISDNSIRIYIPAYGVVVTTEDDRRSYEQIENDIRSIRTAEQSELSRRKRKKATRRRPASHGDLPSQTWLGPYLGIYVYSASVSADKAGKS